MHIILATRRAAQAVKAMQRHSFTVRDAEAQIAYWKARYIAVRYPHEQADCLRQIAFHEDTLKGARTALKAATTRHHKAQDDLHAF